MNYELILDKVEHYYTGRFNTYGLTPRGVDWNSQESQYLRFKQLLKVCDSYSCFSINDYGCGYGALVDYVNSQQYQFNYFGYDISLPMIQRAKEIYRNNPRVVFCNSKSELPVSDYTVASGIFNVKQDIPPDQWQEYVLLTLTDLYKLSQSGFAFNILSKYSDADKRRPDLYYADPCFFFDYCKINFSRNVSILHDYNLYEFTVIVRK